MQPFLYPPPDIKQPVVISEDGGGLVHEYQQAAFRYNVEKRRVEIRGSCRSACTLALGVQNVCVGKGAIVKWHHAFNQYNRNDIRYETTNEMLSQIPFKIAQTVRPYISIEYNQNATLTYAQLLQLGVPDCDGYNQTVTASVTPLPPTPTQPTREQILGSVGYKSGVEGYAVQTATSAYTDEDALIQQKKNEFDAAYAEALSLSTRQHGSPAVTKNCNKGNCEEIAAYYDRKGTYTELHRNLYSGNRVICRLRQEGIFEDSYDCTNWLTGEHSAWHWSRDPLY